VRPFVKQFALCYQTVVHLFCLSCLWCWCFVAKRWMDWDETWHAGRPRPGNIVLDGDPATPPQKEGRAPNFGPMSIVAKWLDGSRWHLAWRWASVQATLC